jgi:hypothetical protein
MGKAVECLPRIDPKVCVCCCCCANLEDLLLLGLSALRPCFGCPFSDQRSQPFLLTAGRGNIAESSAESTTREPQ